MVTFYELHEIEDFRLKFAVIVTKTESGKWVFCKHQNRDTWECPGGHREPGEEITKTAKRELHEETGAIEYTIDSVCIYSVKSENNFGGEETFGLLCFAQVKSFEPELHSEIEKTIITDTLPENWTYPNIQPHLIGELARRGIY